MDIKTIFTIIKNLHSYHLNRDLIGFHDEVLLDPVRNEEVLAFAKVTKDKNQLYQELGLVPPFFLAKRAFPFIKKMLCHRDLRLNMLKVVLARQEIIWHEPLKVGSPLHLGICIHNIYNTAAGEMIELYLTLRHNNRIMIESVIGFIIRIKRKEKKRKTEEDKREREIFRLPLQTEHGQELKFAQMTGDHNFIHKSRLLARAVGLPGRVMHGACVMAMICSVLVKKQVNNDLYRLVSFYGRLAKPVIAGEQLTIKGYNNPAPNEVHFEVLNAHDMVVFREGILKYKE